MINKRRVTKKQRKYLSKRKRSELLWTRVLQFLLRQNEGWRSNTHKSCSFLSKEPLFNGATDIYTIYHLSIYTLSTLLHLKFFKMNVSANHVTWIFFVTDMKNMLIKAALYRKISMFEKKMLELKCLNKEKQDQTALNKCWNFSHKKRRYKGPNPKASAISHQTHHCLT